ncbi:MAG: hypothetical protein ACD_3C00104G0003 [uncultured bacterium (gcode 4)]|uniref:Uncharacterized protein n=1 Tax=uncultured bacterium (gcode 4) TaxID=1234023 RepID=K2FYS3_9BACT|nr:MAG: hypothetical protein ACD_3C00104G0003 [uncultured bacterium (gcode 4)]
MKKIILLWLIFSIFATNETNAYFLPRTDINNLSLKRQFVNLENYLNRLFDEKINSLSDENEALFQRKIDRILDIFIDIDNFAKNKQKAEIIWAVNELRAGLKDLIYFLKTAENKTNATVGIKEPQVELNRFSGDSRPWEITYYSDAFEWWKTSNWNIFSQKFFSAAKCGIPLNKLIQVWLWNKGMIVKVNDRPNCVRFPNLIDLSTISFDFLFARYKWKQDWEYVELWSVPWDYYKQYLPKGTFEDYSISLLWNLPNTYLQNETLNIKWELSLPNRKISIDIIYPSWKKKTLTKYIERWFTFSFILDEIWKYEIWFPWSDGKTAVHVLDPEAFWGKKFIKNTDFKKLDNISIAKETHESSDYAYRIDIPNEDYNILTIAQWEKKYYYSWVWNVLMDYERFDKDLPVVMQIKSSKTITGFSHDFHTEPVVIFEWTVKLQ